MSLVLVLTAGALVSIGTYLLLQRVLTRIVIGLVVLAHGANLLLLASGGRAGAPPIVDEETSAGVPPFADPLPQALALTAIVISFAVLVFLLALAYRSWALTHDDEIEDDVEDRRIAAITARERARSEAA